MDLTNFPFPPHFGYTDLNASDTRWIPDDKGLLTDPAESKNTVGCLVMKY